MKFKKLNISECLFSTATKDYAGRLNFECKDRTVRNGAFSRYCIGISHHLSKDRHGRIRETVLSENRIEREKEEKAKIERAKIERTEYEKAGIPSNEFNYYSYKEPSYITYLYDIAVDSVENNIVYNYHFIGTVNTKDRRVLEEKEREEKHSLGNKITELEQDIEISEKRIAEISKERRSHYIESDTIKQLKQSIRKTKNTEKLKELNDKLKLANKLIRENNKLRELKSDLATSKVHLYSFDINDIDECEVLDRTETLEYFTETNNKYFLFNSDLYYVSTFKEPHQYTQEQLALLLKESIYKENLKFDKLKKQIETFERVLYEASDNTRKREPIPEEVKFEVWRRDEGKCVICGSKENLEFDHVIPFSRGGANTARNLQLLCESCNRKKSDKI